MDPTLLFFAIPIGLGISLPIIGGGLYLYEKRLSKKKKKKPLKPSSCPNPNHCRPNCICRHPEAKAASDTQLVLTGMDAVTGQLRTARSTDTLVDAEGNPITRKAQAQLEMKITKATAASKSDEPVFEEAKIVDKVISDITDNPRSWSIRWSGGNSSKVKSVIKSMPSSQDGRDNEVSISPDGTLYYNRNRPCDNAGGNHKISLPRKDKNRLRQAFDAIIAYKMSGAIDQVVA